MERRKRPYAIFHCPAAKPNRFVYYARFRDASGKYKTTVRPAARGETTRYVSVSKD